MQNLTDLDIRNLINFFEITGILKRIQRTGWIKAGVYTAESVADHSLRTVILCMLYADIQELDTLKLIKMAIIHDLPEAILGDLIPIQKSEKTKKREKDVIQKIFCLLPDLQRENYLAVWNEYQEGKTKEAKALNQLDKIEMALQAKEYHELGILNKGLKDFIQSAKDAIVWPDLNRFLSKILEKN
jgi:putative hydrolase of HD superfamily